jgi:hypothetical protein
VRNRYDHLAKFKQALEEKTKDMNPQEQQAFVEQMMRSMAQGANGQPDCCKDGRCTSGMHGPATTAPGDPEGSAAPAMTEQEQLAFFQSLAGAK